MERPLKDCTVEELSGSPVNYPPPKGTGFPCRIQMNLYLYAVTVLKGRLPPEQHSVMEGLLREKPDEYVKGYFAFLSRRTLWGRIRVFLGV